MAVDDPFDTSDMPTARAHMKRLLVEWRDAGAPVDCLVSFLEGFVACKVSEMMKQREAYSSVETGTEQCTAWHTELGREHCPACRALNRSAE